MTAIKGKNDVADDRDLHGWRKLVAETLKGQSVEALISHSADGLPIEPLYAAAKETHSALLPARRPWRLAQRIDHPDPHEASRLALADLSGGATEMALVFSGSATARGFGVNAGSVETLDQA